MKILLTERINALAEKRGISIRQLERDCKLGNRTVATWDDHVPSVYKVAAVADYFGVSVDYLLGRSSETIVYKPEGFRALDKDGQKQIEDMIEFLLMKQAEKKSDKVGV